MYLSSVGLLHILLDQDRLMRMICGAVFMLVLVTGVVGCNKKRPGGTGSNEPGSGSPGVAKKLGKFTIGKETTHATEPVDADGYVDYPAALNEKLSQGVTPENNANVLIWKALGPNPMGVSVPTGFFDKMKMQPPPATGDYFIGQKQYAADPRNGGAQPETIATLTKLSEQPWTASENPAVSGWLKANEKPLAVIKDAVKRSHYYSPIIPETDGGGSKGLLTAMMPGAQLCREVGAALCARAMLHVGNKQPTEAWQDLLTAHRLARQVGRGGTMVELIVCVAMEQAICRADLAFLERVRPDAESVKHCLRDLLALPPLPNAADKVDLCERFVFLENLMMLDRHGVASLKRLTEADEAMPLDWVDQYLKGIDWNPALENANKFFNQMAAALRENDRDVRNHKLGHLNTVLGKFREDYGLGWPFLRLKQPPDQPASVRGKAVGEMYLALATPEARKVQDAVDRTVQLREAAIVAFALAWHHRLVRRYPDTLEALAPNYLTRVPLDIFNGGSLNYRSNANGYTLYSVGPNGRDDKGAGDDIVVRVPMTAPK
jgi:hypothetical protein